MQGHYLIGYAIIPNHIHAHVHALIALTNTGTSIHTIVANGKRFMAYDVVKRLAEGGRVIAGRRRNRAERLSRTPRN